MRGVWRCSISYLCNSSFFQRRTYRIGRLFLAHGYSLTRDMRECREKTITQNMNERFFKLELVYTDVPTLMRAP